MDTIDYLDEIEDLISWNLSFNIPIKETLKGINRLDLINYFNRIFFLYNIYINAAKKTKKKGKI